MSGVQFWPSSSFCPSTMLLPPLYSCDLVVEPYQISLSSGAVEERFAECLVDHEALHFADRCWCSICALQSDPRFGVTLYEGDQRGEKQDR